MAKMIITWTNGDSEDVFLDSKQSEARHDQFKSINWTDRTTWHEFKDGRKEHIAWHHVRKIVFED